MSVLNVADGDWILKQFDYKNIKHLGSGSFSHVYESTNPKGDLVAAKVTFGGNENELASEKLMQKMKTLDMKKFEKFGVPTKIVKEKIKAYYEFSNKPRHVKFEQFVDFDTGELLDIDIYEAPLANEDLYNELQRLGAKNKERRERGEKVIIDFDSIRKTAKHIFTTLKAMHARGLAHLDIKPENVLKLKSGEKLINQLTDFGFAEDIKGKKDEVRFIYKGTPLFMAPEIENGGRIKLSEIPKIDMYACGVTLLDSYLTSGAKKRAENLKSAIKKAQDGGYLKNIEKRTPKEVLLHKLIKKLLDKDPNNRLTAAQALSDPFITKKNV